jgi:hypothetical protein
VDAESVTFDCGARDATRESSFGNEIFDRFGQRRGRRRWAGNRPNIFQSNRFKKEQICNTAFVLDKTKFDLTYEV